MFKFSINRELKNICLVHKISDIELQRADTLLNLGADPNQTFMFSSPLLIKLMGSFQMYKDKNHDKLAILLLKHGADPNGVDDDESVPLLAWGFSPEVEEELLQYGADPTAKSEGLSVVQILKKYFVSRNLPPEDIELVEQAIEARKSGRQLKKQ